MPEPAEPTSGSAAVGDARVVRSADGGSDFAGAHTGWLVVAAAAVAAVIYGPMLLPGYPLRYDLVSVPRPVLGADALGLGDRLPRAVPLDAATAALARLLPDALLTQVLALLALTLAGWGVAVLTPAPLPGRLFALLVAEWNPFVLEQLAIGHIPHLLAYGALPWVAIFGWSLARRHPERDAVGSGKDAPDSGGVSAGSRKVSLRFAGKAGRTRAWAGLTAAIGFGSLTPGGGVLCVIAAVAGLVAGASAAPRAALAGPAAGGGAGGWRGVRGRPDFRGWLRGRWVVLAGLGSVVVLQLPWLVAAVAAPAFSAPADRADGQIAAFALRSETGWGRLVDAAGLAGMWNGSALPESRHTVLARFSTVLLLALAAAGLPAVRRLWWSGRGPELIAGATAGALGYLVAVLPVLPGGEHLLQTLIDGLPGAGLLRDGHRWLALPAVVIAVLGGLGVSELAARMAGSHPSSSGADGAGEAEEREPRSPGHRGTGTRGIAVVVFLALLVIASMPDLGGGLDGRLRARHYPQQWQQLRAALDDSPDRARVLVLPWQPFRVFAWSGPDPVLDPASRLLPRQSIVSDAPTVAGRRLPEEGLGARAIAADLAAARAARPGQPGGELTTAQLRSLAVGWVLIERGTPGLLPALPSDWTAVLDGPDLTLLRAPGALPSAPRATPVRAVAVVGAQAAAGLLFLIALLLLAGSRWLGNRPISLWASARRRVSQRPRV